MSTVDSATGSQDERSQRSSKALLDAAGQLIVDGGFEAMTLAAIGDRAGYSRGLVTARFGSKDGLIEALLDYIVGGWSHRAVIPRTRKKPGLEGAMFLLEAIQTQIARNGTAIKVLYTLMFEAVGPNAQLRQRMADLHEEFRSDVFTFLTRGIADGSVRADIDVRAESILLLSELRGTVYQWLLDPERFDPLPACDHLISAARERLRAPDSSS